MRPDLGEGRLPAHPIRAHPTPRGGEQEGVCLPEPWRPGCGHCISDSYASHSLSSCQLNPKSMPDILLDPFPGCRVPKTHTIPALVETVSSRNRQKTHKPVTRCQLVEVNGTKRADDCVVGKWGPKAVKRLLSGWREGRWAWREHQQPLRPKGSCLDTWDLRPDFQRQ